MISAIFDKPEYLFRPLRIIDRLGHAMRRNQDVASVQMPWGVTLKVRRDDDIGRAICTFGVYDLVLSETLARLTDRGERAIDVGANLGYATSLLASRVGPNGSVMAFEPNPRLLPLLNENLRVCSEHADLGSINLQSVAVSNFDGEASLNVTSEFLRNCGTASLEVLPTSISLDRVRVLRLDSLIRPDEQIGVMKVDVEGHEHAVFEGAKTLLAKRAVRDIVFEEHRAYPAKSHLLLESFGYSIYRLSRTLRKPLLCSATAIDKRTTVLPNYLATIDPERSQSRMRESTWTVLKYARSGGRWSARLS